VTLNLTLKAFLRSFVGQIKFFKRNVPFFHLHILVVLPKRSDWQLRSFECCSETLITFVRMKKLFLLFGMSLFENVSQLHESSIKFGGYHLKLMWSFYINFEEVIFFKWISISVIWSLSSYTTFETFFTIMYTFRDNRS